MYVLCRYVKVYIFLGTKYGRTCQGRYSDYGDISEAPIHHKKLVSDIATRHSIYIRTVSSYCLLSTLLIQYKLDHGQFVHCNMQLEF